MTEDDAIDFLMQHITHRMNEFFDEHKDAQWPEVGEPGLAHRFARFLYAKDAVAHPIKIADGVVAQHFNSEQVSDDDSMVMAHLKLLKDHGVGLMWMAELFVNPKMPMPDAVREATVQTLRFHADKLERREIDERMKQVFKSDTGTA